MVFEVFSGVSRIYSTAREQRLKSLETQNETGF